MSKILIYVFMIAIFSFMFMACGRDEDELVDAVLVNVDARLCPCCGGFLVQIGENQKDVYQWYPNQESFGVKASDIFPQKVKIKYHFLVNSCVASAGEIDISALIKIK